MPKKRGRPRKFANPQGKAKADADRKRAKRQQDAATRCNEPYTGLYGPGLPSMLPPLTFPSDGYLPRQSDTQAGTALENIPIESHECVVGKYKQELFVINGTSRVRNHLEQKHRIDSQTGTRRKSSPQKSVLGLQKDAAASSAFFWKDSIEKFKELLIRWIVSCHITFFQSENQYFRELLFFLNPALMNHLPKAARTIRSWVMTTFMSKKQQLREDLQHSKSRISISFDLWTSPNPYAILGVVVMWIDAAGKRRSTVLGMRRVYGEHTGENIGSIAVELLKEYNIGGDSIGYFMLDNAPSNDTAVDLILEEHTWALSFIRSSVRSV